MQPLSKLNPEVPFDMFRRLSSLARAGLSLLAASCVAFAGPDAEAAPSSKGNLPIVRDAEIEQLVTEYAAPLLKAAGLSRSGIEIILVNSSDFNAFVSGSRIFVNTGAILATETPGQLQGVLAHEMGHLAGGHQLRLRERIENAKVLTAVTSLLGLGVAAAGAATGSREAAQAGTGIMAGGTGLAARDLMAYKRGEEMTADRAALTYLERAGLSGHGLVDSFRNLDRQSFFSRSSGRNYLSSHPMPSDRAAAIEDAARRSPYWGKPDDPSLVERHQLARAKIAAYTGRPGDARRLFSRDPRSLAAFYGDAIETHLAGSSSSALKKVDALSAARPQNPWFAELKGEILLEAGRGAEAAKAYRTATKLDRSNSSLLRAQIGQALVVSGDPAALPEAIDLIEEALRRDPSNANAYRFLAMAYGRKGDIGRAELATAEQYWNTGRLTDARVFAARAAQKLAPSTPAGRRARDIVSTPRP